MKDLFCIAAVFMLFFVSILAFSHGQCAAGQESGRFFRMGSGKLHLKNMRNNQETRIDLLHKDGSLSEEAFSEVDRVFAFPTREKGEHISPRLLFMLSYFADLVAPGQKIYIDSAYRSPEYNEQICIR